MENQKFTVKVVEGVEEKSTQEIEQQLLDKHAAQQGDVVQEEVAKVEEPAPQPTEEIQEVKKEIEDTDVLDYIKSRYDKDISSVDDLFAQREMNEDLPEDVSAFFKYKKETGRGIEDFVKLQQNYDDLDEDILLTSYYASTEEGLDKDDILDLMEDKFGFDEDFDDEKDIKKQKLAKKRELTKAKKFFKEQQEQYRIPLESSGGARSAEQQEEFDRYRSFMEESKTQEEANKKRYDWFIQKTQDVFGQDFKGFEVSVNDRSYTYKPGDAAELRNKQSDISNFINGFMDSETGMMKDAVGYHRAISIAMNPEKFAQFFYEQGKAEAIDNVTKKSKNIDMVRKAPQSLNKNGLTIRPVGDTSSGRGLRIKSAKRL